MVMVSFLGVRTRRYDAMRALYAQAYRLPVLHETADAVWFALDDRAELHLYRWDDEFHAFFGPGPVPGLFVDDFAEAASRLDELGVEWLTDLQEAAGRQWRHYRAPDGNVYELMGSSVG